MVQMLLYGRYTVGELAEDAGIPDNVASEHLRLMQRCGFFTSQREGRRVYYQVAEPHLKDLMTRMGEVFDEKSVNISFPSLRVSDRLTELPSYLNTVRQLIAR